MNGMLLNREATCWRWRAGKWKELKPLPGGAPLSVILCEQEMNKQLLCLSQHTYFCLRVTAAYSALHLNS